MSSGAVLSCNKCAKSPVYNMLAVGGMGVRVCAGYERVNYGTAAAARNVKLFRHECNIKSARTFRLNWLTIFAACMHIIYISICRGVRVDYFLFRLLLSSGGVF